MIEVFLVWLSLSLIFGYEYLKTRRRPLSHGAPLDEDDNLPWPWAGHASSVFSLTALYGAYLAILRVLGIWPTIGLLLGSVSALVAIRAVLKNWDRSGPDTVTFEQFLHDRQISKNPRKNRIFGGLIVLTQLLFGTSELLLLREVAMQLFLISPDDATIFVVSTALIGYLYCLRGGYRALYRTDFVQMIAVLGMCSILFLVTIRSFSMQQFLQTGMHQPYWSFGINSVPVRIALRVVIGFVMGWAFLVSSPDTWKRVHTVTLVRTKRKSPFLKLVLAGCFPFLLLVPIAAYLANTSSDSMVITQIGYAESNVLFSFIILAGLTASFMSSFDSSLMAATHIHLAYGNQAGKGDLTRFNLAIGTIFLLTMIWGVVMVQFASENVYYLAFLLIGPYAIIGGMITGSLGLKVRRKGIPVPEVLSVAIPAWLIMLHFAVGGLGELRQGINEKQVEAVMAGVALFIVVAIVTAIGTLGGKRSNGDHQDNP